MGPNMGHGIQLLLSLLSLYDSDTDHVPINPFS